MSERKFYSDETLIDEFTSNLTELESDGWTTQYLNKSTGEYWLKYVNEIHRGLTTWSAHLMKINPRPTTNKIIGIALDSPFHDEVIAAASSLYLDEQEYKLEFRGDLIDRLTQINIQRLSAKEKNRLKDIIKHASLLHGINIRPIVGKHHTEIEADAEFFASTSRKAYELLQGL